MTMTITFSRQNYAGLRALTRENLVLVLESKALYYKRTTIWVMFTLYQTVFRPDPNSYPV